MLAPRAPREGYIRRVRRDHAGPDDIAAKVKTTAFIDDAVTVLVDAVAVAALGRCLACAVAIVVHGGGGPSGAPLRVRGRLLGRATA